MPISVLIVDDELQVRRGLRIRLAREQDIRVIGEAHTSRAAVALTRALLPDVVLLDLRLPDADGLSVVPALRSIAPKCRVIVLSLYDEPGARARACALGVAHFVGKHEPVGLVICAVRTSATD